MLDNTFCFRDIDSGELLEIEPDTIEPFGLDALLGTRKEGRPGLPLTMRSAGVRKGEEHIDGNATLTTTIEFNQSPKPYVLVPGGWSPLALARARHFLVDRNVLSLARQLPTDNDHSRLERFRWWWSLLDQAPVSLNPLPAAFEGAQGETLSYGEFVEEFQCGVAQLHNAVSHAGVLDLGEVGLQAAYAEVQAVQSRQTREIEVLMELCPSVLANTVKRDHRREACEAILAAMRDRSLDPFSLVGLCMMSSLYRSNSGGDYSIGHRLLKPTPGYKRKDAYNALSDLRHLEIAALATGIFLDPPALLTEDIALAALWSVLRPKGTITAQGCALILEIDPALFTGLSSDDAERLVQVLRQHQA